MGNGYIQLMTKANAVGIYVTSTTTTFVINGGSAVLATRQELPLVLYGRTVKESILSSPHLVPGWSASRNSQDCASVTCQGISKALLRCACLSDDNTKGRKTDGHRIEKDSAGALHRAPDRTRPVYRQHQPETGRIQRTPLRTARTVQAVDSGRYR